MAEFGVLFGDIAMEITAISRLQERGSCDHDSVPFKDKIEREAFAGCLPSSKISWNEGAEVRTNRSATDAVRAGRLSGSPSRLARTLLPRTSRIVRHLFPVLAVKIAIRIAVGSGPIAGAFPGLHALRRGPGLDQPTVEREMLVRQQR